MQIDPRYHHDTWLTPYILETRACHQKKCGLSTTLFSTPKILYGDYKLEI